VWSVGRRSNDNHIVVNHIFCGVQAHVDRRVAMIKDPDKIFCSDLLTNSKTDPSGVCEFKDCSAVVFVDEFSNFFNVSSHFAGACHDERSSSSTDPLLAAVWHKECSPRA
jgi:hypothetical protein